MFFKFCCQRKPNSARPPLRAASPTGHRLGSLSPRAHRPWTSLHGWSLAGPWKRRSGPAALPRIASSRHLMVCIAVRLLAGFCHCIRREDEQSFVFYLCESPKLRRALTRTGAKLRSWAACVKHMESKSGAERRSAAFSVLRFSGSSQRDVPCLQPVSASVPTTMRTRMRKRRRRRRRLVRNGPSEPTNETIYLTFSGPARLNGKARCGAA